MERAHSFKFHRDYSYILDRNFPYLLFFPGRGSAKKYWSDVYSFPVGIKYFPHNCNEIDIVNIHNFIHNLIFFMDFQTFPTEAEFVTAATNFIAKICGEKQGDVHIALSGGGTPKPIYEALGKRDDIDFSRVIFWQVDERHVSEYEPNLELRSKLNKIMIFDTLIDSVKHNLRGFRSFNTERPIEEALQVYEKDLEEIQESGFDLVLLGIGSDGHTASLFPHSPALHEQHRLVAHTTTDVFDVRDRLTITFPLILKSKNLAVLMKGKDKKDIVREWVKGDKTVDELPAKGILGHEGLVVFFGDY